MPSKKRNSSKAWVKDFLDRGDPEMKLPAEKRGHNEAVLAVAYEAGYEKAIYDLAERLYEMLAYEEDV